MTDENPTSTTPTPKAPKLRRSYRRSGFYAQRALLQGGGISALDGRSMLARAVKDWRSAVASDLGGESELSQAQRTLLDVAAQDVALLAIADAWLQENGPLNRRRRTFVPLVRERLAVAAHLGDLLKTLGLKRLAKQVGLRDRLAGGAA